MFSHKEDITVIYVLFNRTSRCKNWQEIRNRLFGNNSKRLHALLSLIHGTRQKINKYIEDLNYAINQLYLTDMYRTLRSITTDRQSYQVHMKHSQK